jgi:hypothetical protein
LSACIRDGSSTLAGFVTRPRDESDVLSAHSGQVSSAPNDKNGCSTQRLDCRRYRRFLLVDVGASLVESSQRVWLESLSAGGEGRNRGDRKRQTAQHTTTLRIAPGFLVCSMP